MSPTACRDDRNRCYQRDRISPLHCPPGLRATGWGSFLAYAANLQVGTSLECAVFDVLGLVGKDYLRQGCFSGKSAVAKLLAESIGRDAIGGIDVKAVGMRTVLSGIHADRRIGYIQYLQFLELIPQMAEINRVQFDLAGQGA